MGCYQDPIDNEHLEWNHLLMLSFYFVEFLQSVRAILTNISKQINLGIRVREKRFMS